MKLLFAGGAEISVPSLGKCAREYTVSAVLTHPDTQAGRGKKMTVNPVKAEALKLGIPCIEAETLDHGAAEAVRRFAPELLVVVAYGKLFPKSFLSLFPLGGINLHPSLLPKYRGPSPAAAAILNGDKFTGITIQRIAYTMDTGDILVQKTLPIADTETAGSLMAKAAVPGAELLLTGIKGWADGSLTPVPQDDAEASYCRLIGKEDGRIDWREDAKRIERKVRAYDPWPRAFTFYGEKKLLILEAAVSESVPPEGPAPAGPGKVTGIDKKEGILIQTGSGVLAVRRLQLQAKKALDWKAFINGNQQFVGSHLGQT
jgi:methionyl-tRNA formyltransferase